MKNKGFSLVELIVVIAIMAILVGVAVPVYTSYISKAQKNKDIQMVDEVARAMQIYAISNSEGTGWIILTLDGGIGDGAYGETAIEATFGTDWEDNLALSWDEWNSTTDFLDMDVEAAQNLLNSSYLTGSDTTGLLSEVSTLTDHAFGMVGDRMNDPENLYSTMTRFFDSKLIDQYFDITEVDGKSQFNYDDDSKDEFQTQLSNFLVLAVADKMATVDPESGDTVANLIGGYAVANAFANSEHANTNPNIATAYEKLRTDITNSSSVDDIQTAINEFNANEDIKTDLEIYVGENGKAQEDVAAFQHMMNSLADLRESGKLTSDNLKDTNLYSTGAVAEYFNSYVATAGIVTTLTPAQVTELKTQLEQNPGSIAVYISNGKVGCTEDAVYGS